MLLSLTGPFHSLHNQLIQNHFSIKSIKICSSAKSCCKSFGFCSSKTLDLKSFRICTYEKRCIYPLSAHRGTFPKTKPLFLGSSRHRLPAIPARHNHENYA